MALIVMPTTFFDPKQLEREERLDHGIDLLKQNLLVEALVEFDAVLKIDPRNRYARWNRTVAMLSLGDYINGFPEHDSAWAIYDWHSLEGTIDGHIEQVLPLPLWHGEHCRLIVYHEMGFGDAIMLLRFLPEMVARCESVTLIVRKELVSLMQGYGATVLNRMPDLSDYDARVTFFNVMHTMGHTRQTIPNAPYVKQDFKFTGGKMGIAWSGFSRNELTLDSFLSRLDTTGFELYALQKTAAPLPSNVVRLMSKDFKETADLMTTLDHIVSIDTAAVHLAGAIGHPNVHLLLPFMRDWRWWHKDIWYPNIRTYPQDNPDNWDTPLERINKVLHG